MKYFINKYILEFQFLMIIVTRTYSVTYLRGGESRGIGSAQNKNIVLFSVFREQRTSLFSLF